MTELDKDYNLEHLNLGIGTNDYTTSDDGIKAPIVVKAQLDNLHSEQWAEFISKFSASDENNKIESIPSNVSESEDITLS